jgi:hypothetical protein
MQFIDLASPFAIYEGGSGYVLPNVLSEIVKAVIERLERESADDVLLSLRSAGRQILARDTSSQGAGNVWNFFLYHYLRQDGIETPSTASRINLLKLMLSGPPATAWNAVRTVILKDVDELSGWSRSFQKELRERDQVWRAEDGNYYRKEPDGTVYRVIGVRTLREARLDFITEQVAREFGNIRLFLQFFSWLMISNDFVEHHDLYHNSMKAIVQDRRWPSLNHRWSLLQWHATRTVVWRPWSNLCDPQWLAADLLATITDTLAIQPFQPVRVPDGSESQLEPQYVRQADFALETQVRIGEEEAIALTFEGRQFRWINASLESATRVSVGLRRGEDARAAEEDLNRFLSVLVWEHGAPISKESGPMVGQRRALPLILSPSSIFSLNVDPRYPIRARLSLMGEKEKLVLAIFREAVNARSVFYAFLNYWKVIEVIFPRKDLRLGWVDQKATQLSLERERIGDILKINPRVAVYLDYNCRSAIAHVFKKPFVDPDSSGDFVRLSLDLPIVRSLAKIAIKTLTAFS